MGAEQKVAIVTRAGEGIGPGLVRGFLHRNYRVVAVSATARPCFQPDLFPLAGDLGKHDCAERVIAEALSRYGRIDTLVNNTAGFAYKEFAHCGSEDWEGMTGAGLGEFFPLTQRAVEIMLRKNCGHVINIAAVSTGLRASHSPPFLAAVATGCVRVATESLAAELAPQGIRVNAVVARVDPPCSPPPRQPRHGASVSARADVEMSQAVRAAMYLDAAPFVTGEILGLHAGECRQDDN